MLIAHAQFTSKHILPHFADGGCIRVAYRKHVNPTSVGSRLLGGISTSLYLSVSTVSWPSWRHGIGKIWIKPLHGIGKFWIKPLQSL